MIKVFAILVLSTLLLISCNKDDNSITGEKIVGTFQMTDLNSPTNDDYNGDGIISPNLLAEVPCLENIITFREDNTYTYSTTGIIVDLRNDNTVVFCDDPEVGTGTYTLNGNSLNLKTITNTNPDDDEFKIETVNVMIASKDLIITINDPDDGKTISVFNRL